VTYVYRVDTRNGHTVTQYLKADAMQSGHYRWRTTECQSSISQGRRQRARLLRYVVGRFLVSLRFTTNIFISLYGATADGRRDLYILGLYYSRSCAIGNVKNVLVLSLMERFLFLLPNYWQTCVYCCAGKLVATESPIEASIDCQLNSTKCLVIASGYFDCQSPERKMASSYCVFTLDCHLRGRRI
jgi:hypothetical protein